MLPRQWKQSVTNLVGMIAEILKRYVCSIFNYQTIERLNSHEIAISQVISCWEGNGLKDWRLSKRNLSAIRGTCVLKKKSPMCQGNLQEAWSWGCGGQGTTSWWDVSSYTSSAFCLYPTFMSEHQSLTWERVSADLCLTSHWIKFPLVLLTINMAVVIFNLYLNK